MFTGSTEVAKILQKTVAKRLSENGQPFRSLRKQVVKMR
jgi:delta 1-pyrroline-5-carboxylate dehydrogenase